MTKMFLRALIVVGLFAIHSNLAQASSSSLVISQIFPGDDGDPKFGGGYVELFNRGTSAVNLQGWSIQYAGREGSNWTKVFLSGAIPPGAYYLVRTSTLGATVSLRFDAVLKINLDPLGGKIALLSSDAVLAQCPTAGAEPPVDFIGYGATNCSETFRAQAPNDRGALLRAEGGCVDTDRNAGDFSPLDSPSPRNSAAGRNPCNGTPESARRTLAIPDGGGISLQSTGSVGSLVAGSATVQPAVNATFQGLAIFSLRNSRGVVAEATVPATPLVRSGLFYIAINGPVNTGLAIVNPNEEAAVINFSLLDAGSGQVRQGEPVTIAPNSQSAKFLTELPWGISAPFEGSLSFSSSLPIGVVVLRGFTNQRGEFLVTTLPVFSQQTTPSTDTAYIAQFAVNEGWKTEVILINPSSTPVTGTLDFLDAAGTPVNVRIGSINANTIDYFVLPQAATRVSLNGTDAPVQVGSIRVAPTAGSGAPSALAIFSYTRNGITVSETGLAPITGGAFRTYVEVSGVPGAAGSVDSGFALTNASAVTTDVVLELYRLDGTTTGLSKTVRLSRQEQMSRFLHEVFPDLAAPFQGILRISTAGSISVVGLRGRYNNDRDFLLTTIPPQNEASAIPQGALFFPQIVDAGGYTTQLVILNGRGNGVLAGTLRFVTTGGRPLALEWQ